MTFWTSSTTEEKLAQIDGGIECGLSRRHVAINLGTTAGAVGDFANRHGRTFGASSEKNSRAGKAGGRIAGLIAGRRRGVAEIDFSAAFSIFGSAPSAPRLFSSHPHDEEAFSS